ncbi:Uncharacterised protein [Pseudomonas putida]|uniref:hypothetical protein n=1 Tax=Pseudomonas asiatica TaxID=2219225 RepID=UPI0010BFE665|nr:hypothetical protein [Pseudomonas asiatica]CAB5637043.1 Uncharacterised protein [Pseudomonas putida]MBO2923297.1 hypothetical protein [Pseudomonas asiatica]WPU60250.1 hypothetical protein SQW15_26760 [Pseudomonas asiatica]CAB5683539.1 Uncharacterised protein [Pseudomonas putida]CAB5712657.1 Uncharacterised protein [Pseudomonas putida]
MSKREISQAAKEILESMGLKRGRGRINSVVSRSAAKIPATQGADQPSKASTLAAPAPGPVNRFMYLEARKWAIELVASLRGSPVEVVVERLAGATAGRPGSYVAGINSVITELEAADVTGCRDNQNLTRQAGRKV